VFVLTVLMNMGD